MANCPRCQTALANNQVDEFFVRLCAPCKGMLMPHADVVQIIERSWHAVKPEDAEKLEFRTSNLLKTEPVYKCPDCRQSMDKYGYMGLAAIPLNRCDPCSLLWLDADELQNMILALARTNYRSETARIKEWHASHEDIIAVAVTNAAVNRMPRWLFSSRRGAGVVAETLLELFR